MVSVVRLSPQMLSRYEEARDAGVDVSGLWIQDWSGTIQTLLGYRVYWNWRWNETYYPGKTRWHFRQEKLECKKGQDRLTVTVTGKGCGTA